MSNEPSGQPISPGSQPPSTDRPAVEFELDGRSVQVPDDGATLLGALRDQLGVTSVKDGCSPQGQCGCCTVLVDGQPRVSCVTPARRVRGRSVVTLEGLDPDRRTLWTNRLCETGGSQCGFCTPGIVLRLEALAQKTPATGTGAEADLGPVRQALLAHLCRCTGWQTILEAWNHSGEPNPSRDLDAAARRATLEGGTPQQVGPHIAAGDGGFAADTAPADALLAVSDGMSNWVVADTLDEARRLAGKTQGRRTTEALSWPIPVPDGDWAATLATTWVEPGYLETDAAWCHPGGNPVSALANGGAFGAKTTTEVGQVARRLADEHQRPVLALYSREDTVRLGPKRPPLAGGCDAAGRGIIHAARTPGIAQAITAVAPEITVVEVDIPGPPTSADLRAAGWAEAMCLLRSAGAHTGPIAAPNGSEAEAVIASDGAIEVRVRCGQVLDAVVLRSYAIGAAHMAWSWVTSEGLRVDDDGVIGDLTVRSFGITRAVDMPEVRVELVDDDTDPVNGSDAVFVAVASAAWAAAGHGSSWPTGPAIMGR